jgi:hypothetical protein
MLREKTLLSIFLPATGKSYEMWIPDELSVHEAQVLVGRALEEQEEPYFALSETSALYEMTSGVELDVNMRIGELDFVNGTHLMFV